MFSLTEECHPVADISNGPCGLCGQAGPRTFTRVGRAGALCGKCLFGQNEKESEKPPAASNPAKAVRMIRLHTCFGCDRPASMEKMSRLPVLCRDCYLSRLALSNNDMRRFERRVMRRFQAALGRGR